MKALVLLFLISFQSKADVLLKDIGILGLASHDMFTWDSVNEVNQENGRLDLSTIFDFDEGRRWKRGGNPKNAENAPVYTVTMNLVSLYKASLKQGLSSEEARKFTVSVFHKMVKESFERMMMLPYPETGLNQKVSNIEQAAMRGLHDILPGRVKLFGRIGRRELNVANVWFAKTMLNQRELDQVIAFYDGDYAVEYQTIKIPFTKKVINLKKVDADFIKKFSPYTQEDMLQELGRLGRGEILSRDISFMHHLSELFSKGICSESNDWLPEVPCH